MPPAGVIVALQVVGVAAAVAAALRWRTRATFAVAWVVYLVLAGLRGSRGKVLHNDLLLAVVPRRRSCWRRSTPRGTTPRRPDEHGWPVRVAMVHHAPLVYFFAGYHKLRRSGLDWAIGDNVRYVMLWGPTHRPGPVAVDGRAGWGSTTWAATGSPAPTSSSSS